MEQKIGYGEARQISGNAMGLYAQGGGRWGGGRWEAEERGSDLSHLEKKMKCRGKNKQCRSLVLVSPFYSRRN